MTQISKEEQTQICNYKHILFSEQLKEISSRGNIPSLKDLGLSRFEYEEIKKRLKRDPNTLELFLFSAMWSEHCGYKHSKKYLSLLPKKNSCFSSENSGGIKLGRHIIFFKTESHNHPSAVEPYQGAATGIGGILRDILAMNARPIALLNSLKFGPLEPSKNCTKEAAKRNKYLLNGVIEGISDYGNSTGVPNIGGETDFNDCFNLSPLVNVMAVGICNKNKVKTSTVKENSYIVLLGTSTGRDGLFGAAFASKELENNFEDRLSVQIGDPYIKKNIIEATLEILTSKNVTSCQDLGAAGLLSSTSEMAAKGNVKMDLYLDKVPLREKDMQPYEIMLSESQERMIFGANKKGVDEIKKIAEKYELNASIIGKTSKGDTYNLYYKKNLLASLPVSILTEPVLYDLNPKKPDYIDILENKTLPKKSFSPNEIKYFIFKICASPEFASKKYLFTQYDSTVGARTLQNPHRIGVAPLNIFEEKKIVGFSMDSNENSCYLNPCLGAFNLVFESYRNAVSSGFEPLGITNCLNFANPENPDVAYQFTQTINGLKDALNLLKIPVVSGNVSFYNEGYDKNNKKIKIYPTPTIGLLSVLKFKTPIYAESHPNDTIFLIGKTAPPNLSKSAAQKIQVSNTGGSLYQKLFFNFLGEKLDTINFPLEQKLKNTIFKLKQKNLLAGAIDVSKGGILGALLILLFNSIENQKIQAFKTNQHIKLGFSGNFTPDIDLLFGETTGRYLISTKNKEAVEKYLIKNKIPYAILGKANTTGILDLGFTKMRTLELNEIYQNSLSNKAW